MAKQTLDEAAKVVLFQTIPMLEKTGGSAHAEAVRTLLLDHGYLVPDLDHDYLVPDGAGARFPEGESNAETANQALVRRTREILSDVACSGYVFEVFEAHGGVVLRAQYDEADTYTQVKARQTTRKWILSPHMTRSEIVQTAFKCAATSFEHRVRESFRYKGARIFGPHFDVNDLVELCRTRENAGGRR